MSGSSPDPSTHGRMRTAAHGSASSPYFPVLAVSSPTDRPTTLSRLEAAANGRQRLPTATESATARLPGIGDPDLAAVVDTWPTLPEALKAGILAMVKAASGK